MAKTKTRRPEPANGEPSDDLLDVLTTDPKELGQSARSRLLENLEAQKDALVERDGEIDLAFTALVAGEHVFYWGDPGVAKSRMAENLGSMIDGPKFQYLLTKFTDPSELFGVVDVPALKVGDYRRVVKGMLPGAVFAFLDETIKGSSAILNCLLTLLNERKVKFGSQEIDCPLQILVGASNETPNDSEGGQEIGALFDRFLFRKEVKPVSRGSGRKELFKRAVNGELGPAKVPHLLTPADLVAVRDEARILPWSNGAKKALMDILTQLDDAGVSPGDRRMTKSFAAARASAYLSGSPEVRREHLEVLGHVLWVSPEQARGTKSVPSIVAKVANPSGALIAEKLAQAEEIYAAVRTSQDATQAIPKLQEIQDAIAKEPESRRRDDAVTHVADLIEPTYRKVIGAKTKSA